MEHQEFDIKDIPTENIDKLNSLDLRSDLENEMIVDGYLRSVGYIGNRPSDFKGDFHEDDTWAIDCIDDDGEAVISYLYVSEFEYEQDLKLLKRNLVMSK